MKFAKNRELSPSVQSFCVEYKRVRSRSPSTVVKRRSPSLPEGGKGFVQISMFLQRISFVSVILHIKKEYFI